jgi:hypothetical protein
LLDFHRLHDQLSSFRAYRLEEEARLPERLSLACDTLAGSADGWEQIRDGVSAAARRGEWRVLSAGLWERPDGRFSAPSCPRPMTVVATDGSQIYPDRHVEPTCYLLNVSRIAFHYGTDEEPIILAEPELRYRARDLEDLRSDDGETAYFDLSTEVVSALRDEQELRWLLDTARAERRPGRPTVALADGTLIRWMLRGMKHRSLEERLLGRYLLLLEGFRKEDIPVASYVSQPANTELVNLLRFVRGETEVTDEPLSLRGLLDRMVFEQTLSVGERSAVFVSGSHIQREYGAEQQICYFYVRLPEEVGRVELPAWLASDPQRVDTLHAVILDECKKGGGYPMILTEAHQRAVVRAPEKALFYRILEREMQAAGLGGAAVSQKAQAKRMPRI